MMGSASVGEFGSLYDLLALLDDKSKYESKLKELDGRLGNANGVLTQAAEENRQAEGRRSFAAETLEKAAAKVAEANAVAASNEKRATALAAAEKALAGERAAFAAERQRWDEELNRRNTAQQSEWGQKNAGHEARKAELDANAAALKKNAAALELKAKNLQEAEAHVASRKDELTQLFARLRAVLESD